jgi:ribosomal protein S27E
MNTWDEKNYIKPKSNCLNNNEQEPSDTTKITKSDSTQPQWIDIGGVKKWIRHCPECKVGILCPTKRQAVKCTKKGVKCIECGYKNKIVPPRKPKPKRIPTREELTRNCPKCSIELLYKTKEGKDAANTRNAKCKDCQNKATRIYETPDKLERNCPDCGKLMQYTKGKDLSIRRHRWLRDTRENRLCNKCVRSGSRNGMAGTSRCGKDNPNYGNKWSKKQKTRMREISVKKYIERGYILTNYNPNACKYFDKLSKEKKWNLQHAENGGEVVVNGYFLDAYDKDRNIVVEYDEPNHFLGGKLKQKDVDRMNEIKQTMGCTFYRYDERTKKIKRYN